MSTSPPDFAKYDPGASYRGASNGDILPAHAAPTYYDRPLLKKPHWEWEVILYLFMGGVMGGSGILAALADEEGGDAELARSARYLSFALASTCPLVLVKHLGRPERFLHMLRIVKFKSVMSMGVWGLIAFSLPATAGAAGQAAEDGLLPGWIAMLAPRVIVKPLQALLGAFIAGYTGVLISATAIPAWAIGKRFIPAFSVCSGLAGACAANAAILSVTGGNARTLAKEIEAVGEFELIGAEHDEQLPLVAFKLSGEHSYDEFDVSAQLAAERGWMVPAYTLPPNAEHIKIMRVLVKETLGQTLIQTLGADIARSCATLQAKGTLHPADRKRVKTNTGF